MAKSKLLQIWISKSEELDDEMRLKKNKKEKVEDIINNKEKVEDIMNKKEKVEDIINKKEKVKDIINNKEKLGENIVDWEETAFKNGGQDTEKKHLSNL